MFLSGCFPYDGLLLVLKRTGFVVIFQQVSLCHLQSVVLINRIASEKMTEGNIIYKETLLYLNKYM